MRIVIVLLICFLTSCNSLKKIPSNAERIPLSENQLYKFNGNYSVMSIDSSMRTLDYSLLVKSPYNFLNVPSPKDYISLEVINKKRIRVSNYENGRLIRSRILKGKLNDNNFIFKRRFVIKVLILVNGISYQKTRIGLLEDGSITMDTKGGGLGFLLLFPFDGGGTEHYKLIFKKIN